MMVIIILQKPRLRSWNLLLLSQPKHRLHQYKLFTSSNKQMFFVSFWQDVRKLSSFISGNDFFWQDVRTLFSFIYSNARSNLRWRRDLLLRGGCNEPLRGFASEQARCRVVQSCFSSFNHKLWAPGRRQRQGESNTDPEMTVITYLLYKLGQSTRQARN